MLTKQNLLLRVPCLESSKETQEGHAIKEGRSCMNIS
jgi:hypothetical protein